MATTGARRLKPYANLSPAEQAHVAFMRFGLGPKADTAARLSAADGAAYDACLREISNPSALLIPDEQVIFNQALINLRPGAAQKPDVICQRRSESAAAFRTKSAARMQAKRPPISGAFLLDARF